MKAMKSAEDSSAVYKEHIREIPDFPKKGIGFKDLTPLLANGQVFSRAIDRIVAFCKENHFEVDAIASPEARGFIVGSALAYRLRTGFVPIRKPGKLPYKTASMEYQLEYGTDKVEMHIDAVSPGQKVLLVDDLLATGGTIEACARLLERSGARVLACAFLVELSFLKGRERLKDLNVFSLVRYP